MGNRKTVFSFISMIIFTTFLISVNSQQTEVSFIIDEFIPGDPRITLQGSASILDGNLAFINRQSPIYNTGRALYSNPIRMWDRFGNNASIQNHFAFVVENIAGVNPGDGIIFFLSPTPDIPTNSSGGKLGVVNPNNAFNNFVGVEFDNFVDPWDPSFPHIGIDVNSLYSLQFGKWNWTSGLLVFVDIHYDPPGTLRVHVNTQGQRFRMSQSVDFTMVLPEFVYVGLSATTSIARQLITVQSWYFVSCIPTGRPRDPEWFTKYSSKWCPTKIIKDI